MIDDVRRARLTALIAADLDAIERRDELPPWWGLPEDARVIKAWRALVAVDVSDRTRHIDEVQADLRRASDECRAALAARDDEYQAALDAPRPTLRRLRAELERIAPADLVKLAREPGPLGVASRALTRRSA